MLQVRDDENALTSPPVEPSGWSSGGMQRLNEQMSAQTHKAIKSLKGNFKEFKRSMKVGGRCGDGVGSGWVQTLRIHKATKSLKGNCKEFTHGMKVRCTSLRAGRPVDECARKQIP